MNNVLPMLMDYVLILFHALVASVLGLYGLNKLMPKKVAFNRKAVLGMTLVLFAVVYLKTRFF